MDQTWAHVLGDRAPVLQSMQVALEASWEEWADDAPSPAGLQGVEAPSPSGGSDHHGSEYSPSVAGEGEGEEEDDDDDEGGYSPPNHASDPGNDSSTTYRGIIQDQDDYYTKRTARRNSEEQKFLDMGVESDCPEDPAEQRVWIGRLFDAIKNTVGIIDKPCKNGAPAQSVQRLKDNYYNDEAIEIACWDILLNCRQASLGVRMVDPHHQTKREGEETYSSFAERMEQIIEVCKISKAACKQVLDPGFIHRFVDAPANALKMKESNLRINTQRNIQNEIGRETIKKEGIVRPGLNTVKTPTKAKGGKARGSPTTTMGSNRGSTFLTPAMKRLKPCSSKRSAKYDDDDDDDEDDEDYEGNESDEYSPPKRRATRKRVASVGTPSKGKLRK